jgi:hypothetical protein
VRLDAADFHDPVAIGRVEPGGFSIENDFAQRLSPSCPGLDGAGYWMPGRPGCAAVRIAMTIRFNRRKV